MRAIGYADGTFDIVLELFPQVYTLHAICNGRCLPMIYGVLPRKDMAIYVRYSTEIRTHLKADCFPSSINSDFELSFIKAEA